MRAQEPAEFAVREARAHLICRLSRNSMACTVDDGSSDWRTLLISSLTYATFSALSCPDPVEPFLPSVFAKQNRAIVS